MMTQSNVALGELGMGILTVVDLEVAKRGTTCRLSTSEQTEHACKSQALHIMRAFILQTRQLNAGQNGEMVGLGTAIGRIEADEVSRRGLNLTIAEHRITTFPRALLSNAPTNAPTSTPTGSLSSAPTSRAIPSPTKAPTNSPSMEESPVDPTVGERRHRSLRTCCIWSMA